MQDKYRKKKVFYAAGPGDVVGTFRCWERGLDDSNELAVCYSAMFFDACTVLGVEAYVVSTNPRIEIVQTESFKVENRPRPRWGKSGLAFHFARILYSLRLIGSAWRAGANVAIIADFHHWWVWSIAGLLRIDVVPSLHCAFWAKGHRKSNWLIAIVDRLNRLFWRFSVKRTICISPEVQIQLQELAGERVGNLCVQARAHYRRETFSEIHPPPSARDPFYVLFAGRLERNKGVFDLVEIATLLKQTTNSKFVFELCGSGSAEQNLQKQIDGRDLAGSVVLRGKLMRQEVINAFGRSHVVVVPTTASFAEGLNKVAVEAILSGRPCLTSQVCHATEVLGEAVVEVPVGDVEAYAQAIQRLQADPSDYARHVTASRGAQEQFYDVECSWGKVLERVLRERLEVTRKMAKQ